MTNTELLRRKMEESGYKFRYIAEKAGLSYQGFLNKLENKREFKASEIHAICELLGITESERSLIFFATKVG